ncbi:MAG: chloride channel protein, partial [Bacteroidaceae bacterium]|nr:chloride channel protein [Bacteroidaceae bacterium]
MEDTKELNTPWLRLGAWVESHTSPRQFLLMLSLAVGVGAAIAAQTLKWLIHEIEFLLTHRFDVTQSNGLFLVYPVVGIMLTALFIRYLVRDDIG